MNERHDGPMGAEDRAPETATGLAKETAVAKKASKGLSRRTFVKISGVAGTGLTLGVQRKK